MDLDEEKHLLVPLLVLSQGFGLSATGMMIYYSLYDAGGLKWSEGPTIQFNYHPILMVGGLIYLNGTAIMLYRTFPKLNSNVLRITHSVLQFLVMVMCIAGAFIAYRSKILLGSSNVHSLHTIVGLISGASFTAQWSLSVLILFGPPCPDAFHTTYKAVHVYVGGTIMFLSIISVLTGIYEKAHYSNLGPDYHVSLLLASIALTVMFFGLTVSFVMANSAYKRPADAYQQMN